MIREMNDRDAERVLAIYKMGIDTGHATFEKIVPDWKEWDARHLKHSRFVYEKEGRVLGWTALSPVSTREVYRGVAELSIYVDSGFLGKGIGSLLMDQLLISSEQHGIWTLFSSLFPENTHTLQLHEKFGFRIIGVRERIGLMDGRWRDTLILERRSRKVGI
jgi:L-amino acid N-acyltransferase YncA